MKLRNIRRSAKFTPRWVATPRRRQEQVASLYSMALVKMVLAIFLFIGSYRSYLALTARSTDLSFVKKTAVPGLFVIAALFFLRSGVKDILEARDFQKPPNENAEI